MKQTRSEEAVQRSSAPSVKKVGTMLGASAIAVLMIGGASVFALADRANNISGKETQAATECKTSAVQTADEEVTEEAAVSTTVSWWKAGVEEYGFVEGKSISETTTTTTTAETTTSETTTTTSETTTKETTTTTKKTTTTAKTTAAEKKASSTKAATAAAEAANSIEYIYAIDNVNMRTAPSTEGDVITVIANGTKLEVVEGDKNGWSKVKYADYSGYCMAKYLSKKAPATTTTAATTKAAAETVKKTKETTKAVKTTAAAKETTKAAEKTENKNTAVISYTDEEFSMMCYVLQSEVGGCSESSKIAVANVIINRVKSSRFSNTLSGVLTAPNQFTAIKNYYNKKNPPSQNTIDCAKRALNGEGAEASKGAVYYYAPRYCGGSTAAWFESLTFCMELEGQRFFK